MIGDEWGCKVQFEVFILISHVFTELHENWRIAEMNLVSLNKQQILTGTDLIQLNKH